MLFAPITILLWLLGQLLKLVVRDIAHYDRIYRRLIAAVPGLTDVSSTFSMERMKATTALVRPV